jgi:protein-tyrosine phosphatase
MKVLFVCTGNICRSPAAHAVLEHRLAAAVARGERWAEGVQVDSVGLGGWHEGELPDPRARRAGKSRGYTVDSPARAIRTADLRSADWVLAMDHGHIRHLQKILPPGFSPERLRLLRSFDPASPADAEVEDPYYGPDSGFDAMFVVIEAAMPGLLQQLQRQLAARPQ